MHVARRSVRGRAANRPARLSTLTGCRREEESPVAPAEVWRPLLRYGSRRRIRGALRRPACPRPERPWPVSSGAGAPCGVRGRATPVMGRPGFHGCRDRPGRKARSRSGPPSLGRSRRSRQSGRSSSCGPQRTILAPGRNAATANQNGSSNGTDRPLTRTSTDGIDLPNGTASSSRGEARRPVTRTT